MKTKQDAGAILAAFEVTCRAAWDAALDARLKGRRESLFAYFDVLTVAKEQMELLELSFFDRELQALDPYSLMTSFVFAAGDGVILLTDLPDAGLKAGQTGTVTAKHEQSNSQRLYEVVFDNSPSVTCSLTAHQLVPDAGQSLD